MRGGADDAEDTPGRGDLVAVGGLRSLRAARGRGILHGRPSPCESSGSGHSGDDEHDVDCDPYTGRTYIGFDFDACDTPDVSQGTPAVTSGCDDSSYWYDVYTVGWSEGGTLYIYQTRDTPPWEEVHTLPPMESSKIGHWDNLYLDLKITDHYARVEDGVKTLYDCSDETNSGLTWHIEVIAGGSTVDCAVWGHDTETLGTDCEVW